MIEFPSFVPSSTSPRPAVSQDPQTSRTLKLISKTINSLGSCVGSRSSAVSCKEDYMRSINEDFFTDSYLRELRMVSVRAVGAAYWVSVLLD